jgi:hypothetical protein
LLHLKNASATGGEVHAGLADVACDHVRRRGFRLPQHVGCNKQVQRI